MFSRSCIYGLRAAIYVAAYGEDRTYVSIREISRNLDISFHFLTKILQQLTEGGLMKSWRGPSGGVALARPASRISMLDIINVLESKDLFSSCVLGLPGCGERAPCPVHKQWGTERRRLKKLFEGARLSRIALKVKTDRLRLSDVPIAGEKKRRNK